MKTRVTFRVADDLAEALRELPNQTAFVEDALRDALGLTCPVCRGEGRIRLRGGLLPNFREADLPALDRGRAMQLRALTKLARGVAATRIALRRDEEGRLAFSMQRERSVLLAGFLDGDATRLSLSDGGVS